MTIGAVLAERRGERGLTIEQVASATRIRADHLRALESNEPERLPAPVYAKGYLRTYALFLGLDPEPLIDVLHSPVQHPGRALGLGMLAGRPRMVLTGPAAAAVGLVLLGGAFAYYAWRQVEADQRPPVTVPSGQQVAVVPTAAPSPSPQPRPIVVGVKVTDAVWLNVVVDGKSEYTDSGKILPAGSEVYFTGVDIKITSGKAAATMISVDGHALGALGTGVATREFSSQTSP